MQYPNAPQMAAPGMPQQPQQYGQPQPQYGGPLPQGMPQQYPQQYQQPQQLPQQQLPQQQYGQPAPQMQQPPQNAGPQIPRAQSFPAYPIGQFPTENTCTFVGQVYPSKWLQNGFGFQATQNGGVLNINLKLRHENARDQSKNRIAFINVVAFGPLAQQLANQIGPGTILKVTTDFRVDSFTARKGANAGQTRRSTKFHLSDGRNGQPSYQILGSLPIYDETPLNQQTQQAPQQNYQQPQQYGLPQPPQQQQAPQQPQQYGVPQQYGMPQQQPQYGAPPVAPLQPVQPVQYPQQPQQQYPVQQQPLPQPGMPNQQIPGPAGVVLPPGVQQAPQMQQVGAPPQVPMGQPAGLPMPPV